MDPLWLSCLFTVLVLLKPNIYIYIVRRFLWGVLDFDRNVLVRIEEAE